MKKVYSTSNLVKVVSLGAAMATLLSSVSSVFAANLSITGGLNRSTSGPGVSYPHGSHGSIVFAGDDDYCGADNIVGRGGKQQQLVPESSKITVEEQYQRFIENQAFNGYNPYGTTTQQAIWNGDSTTTQNSGYMGLLTGGTTNALPEAFGVYSFATGCGSAATGNYSTAFGAGATAKAGGAQAFGVSALASGKASVAMGVGSEASGESTVALGGLATATGKQSVAIGTKTKAQDNYAVAIGIEAEAQASGSIAIGSSSSKRTANDPNRRVIAKAENSIAIGTHTFAEKTDSVAIGANAQALVEDGVAVGGGAVSRVGRGVNGYDPVTGGMSTEVGEAWKSTAGAFSVGDLGTETKGYKITRQITGVAAGTEDTDAVNVAQLKALKNIAAGAWKLSVNGGETTDVNPGNTVDFSVDNSNVEGAENLKIAKESDNNIKFALNENLKLTSVTAGRSTMSDDGFIFNSENGPRMTIDGFSFANDQGPSITIDGIDGGNKKITGVEKGSDDNDAVNFAQLKEIRNEIAGDRLVKWQEDGQLITIGKEKGGTRIDIAGSDGERTIAGVKAGEQDSDAVNYGQFKAVKNLMEEGWKLSVNGQNESAVTPGSTVDFVAAKQKDNNEEYNQTNIKIVKDNNNKVTFDLSEIIRIEQVMTGKSHMSHNGFVITGGPRMTTGGIHAGKERITGVKAAEYDTDAVNLAQLNKVKEMISKAGGWKLSVSGQEATSVAPDSTVDFSVDNSNVEGAENLKIAKEADNNIKFALNENLKLTSVNAGRSTLSDEGFVITDGPSMTGDGIDGGNKKITGVEKGSDDNDAVNFAQLKEIKNEIADNTLVKWQEDEQLITIGKEKGGTRIDIAGSDGERTIAGVKAGEQDSDAVNYGQFKAVKNLMEEGWKLSVNGQNESAVTPGSKIDLVAAKQKDSDDEEYDQTNITIVKDKDNKVTFDLNKLIRVDQVIAGGTAVMSHNGFVITDGPRMTTGGIHAGDKEVTGVAAGVNDTDAVNVAQLKEIKNEIVGDSLVQWVEEQNLITIGAQKGGTKIDIANQSGANRIISGVANGKINDSSKEAINGSQINKIAGDIANYFGGDAAFVDGAFVGPRYNLTFVGADGETEQRLFNDVGSALKGLDGNVKNVNSRLTHVSNVLNQRIDNFSKDALLWSENERAFVARHGDGENQNSKITFLLDGEISEDSTDAINGSQLFKIAENTSKFFGGSANVINGTKPAFLIDGESYDNVTDAFIGVNTFINNINDKIIDMEKNDLVQQDASTNIITIGKKTAGTEISVAGYGDSLRTISGVRKAEKGDQAVNKDQLDESIEKISQNIEVATAAAVLYDKNKDGTVNYGSVTLGGKNNNNEPVALLNVKNGNIAEDSHDAINGSQINTISKDIAKFFGGDTKFENGTFSAPTYTLSVITEDGQGGNAKVKYHDVGSALKGLDGNIQSVDSRLTTVVNEFTNKLDGFSNDALLWSEDEQAFVAKHGKNGEKTKSKLKFLLDGEIAQGSTDAITGNQLYLLNQTLATYFGGGAKYENGQWTAPDFKISQFDANGTAGEKKSYNNVADAFDGINNGMSNINNRINDVINKVDSDALKWNEEKKAYDAGRGGKPNKITNVADGKIAENSKDAVNGGQLWQTNERISDVEKDVKHLGNRVDNMSNTVIDIGKTVTNIENKVDGIAEDAVRYDRDENGKKINKVTLKGGDAGEPVVIDNVADGKIETDSKEAINGGQLHDYTKQQMQVILDQSKNYTDQRVNNIVIDAIDDAVERANHYTNIKFDALSYSIENVRKEARQAAAIGLAVSNLRYNDMPGKLSIGFGSGLWRSQSAFAFGAGYTSENGSIRSNVSVTTSGGHWGVGAGFNMTLN